MAKKPSKPKPPKPEKPEIGMLMVAPRSVIAGHPVRVRWSDLESIRTEGPEGAVPVPMSGPSGSMTWSFRHAGIYRVIGVAGEREIPVHVRVR